MFYTTTVQSIMGLDGKAKSLRQALVRTPGRPANGWRASFPVGGQQMTVQGNNPVEVYNATLVLLGRNGIAANVDDIWLNLNIQWLSRTPEKYHMVPVGDLLLISKPGEEKEKDKQKRSYKPSDWGMFAWGWMNLFLARSEYNYREFLLQVNYVLDMLNPATNPEIGCADCYLEFSKAVENLKSQAGLPLEGARQWLWNIHNQVNQRVGKKVLTFAEASKKAFWT